MKKCMVEYIKKIENRGIKIPLVNFILITKSINLQFVTLILNYVGVRCDRRRFSVLSPLIEKSMLDLISMTPMSDFPGLPPHLYITSRSILGFIIFQDVGILYILST